MAHFLSTRTAATQRFLGILAFSALAFAFAAPGWGAEDDSTRSNAYVAGAEVRIDRPVDGDVVAAAGRIHVDPPVAGDAVIGAGSLDLQAAVGDDPRAAGGIVTVGAAVQGEVLIAAAKIIFSKSASIHGQAWLAAASVTLAGRTMSAIKVHARDGVGALLLQRSSRHGRAGAHAPADTWPAA